MIASGTTFKEIWIQSKAVTGLIKMNKKKTNEQFDLVFLKALLVGLLTIKKIKDVTTIEAGILDLAKDLFEWRVQKDEHRMRAYEKLLNTAFTGIRNNNFK